MSFLTGIRVLDFGWVWAGAVPGQLLAFLGAEVIKVEGRTKLDSMRMGLPLIGDKPDPEQQPMFHNVNRGKMSLGVDLKRQETRELVLDLVEHCDVVIENFAPGVMSSLGLGYDVLSERRPDLVMLSLSGGGQDGDLRGFKSYAATIAAYAGVDSQCRYEDGEFVGLQMPYADPNASLYGALGVLSALHAREEQGGCHIDVAQVEAGVVTMGEGFAAIGLGLEPRTALGNGSDSPAARLEGTFECASSDWLAVSIWSDDEARTLAKHVGADVLASGPDAVDIAALRAGLDGWCRTRGHLAAMRELQSIGIDCGAVTSSRDRFVDAHFKERGSYKETDHPVIGWEVVYAVPWMLDGEREPEEIRRAPLLGEHNEHVVRTILERSPDEYRRLVREGVLQ